jgi:hypothetical protein
LYERKVCATTRLHLSKYTLSIDTLDLRNKRCALCRDCRLTDDRQHITT